jgi:hypothetical protein
MATTKPLNEGRSTTLSGAGTGVVDLLVPKLQSWHVTRIAVLASSNTSEPTAKVYVDAESPANFLAGTYTGSNDSSDEDLWLMPGQHLICRWTGGDAAASCTLSVFGQVSS